MPTYNHSVKLDKAKCKGCTTCLRHCPTEAIRVYDGCAHIIAERCIDCGMCIKVCPYHAKVAVTDPLKIIEDYKYKIALPAPTLYGQFKTASTVDKLLEALLVLGFDDVFEVARGAEMVTPYIAQRVRDRKLHNGVPLISSACPAILRLLQVRFPELLPNVVDVISPMEAAAIVARKRMMERTGCAAEEVGVFFITPCPAKMTAVRSPLFSPESPVSGVISILDLYGQINAILSSPRRDQKLSEAGNMGVGWARSGGEMLAVGVENSLNVDGIENVIQVLEAIENGQLSDLEFFEGLACTGGCLGGPLTVENTYVAKNRLRKLIEKLPKSRMTMEDVQELTDSEAHTTRQLEAKPVMKLDDDISVALQKMQRIEEITEGLPGLDCGSCGSPSCRALAEDIAFGYAVELDCIYILKQQIKKLAQNMVDMADTTRG